MVINGQQLLKTKPLYPMYETKERFNGVSFGLSEAGYDVRLAQDVTLHGFKKFSLASTVENFSMPNNTVGILHDKSSLIRQKVFVGNTVLEPGWEGFLTLEIFYMGYLPIKLKAGQGIGQVIFHQLAETANYDGKYQHQPNRPVETIYEPARKS